MPRPVFQKRIIGELINADSSGKMNTLGCVADINSDGRPDYVTCGRNGTMAWFENKGDGEWAKHHIARVASQECGGCAFDLTGNGFPDIINGSDASEDEMNWWENTGDFSSREWTRRVIAKTGRNQMHDTMIGEIKNDGIKYLAFTNQGTNVPDGGTTIYCIPIPADPYQSPWPGLEIIAEGKHLPNSRHTWNSAGVQPEEGLALGDVDHDGKDELVCGTSYYKWVDGKWKAVRFTDRNYITCKIAVADIDNDGKNEIILSEGDAYIYGHDEGCKLAWFKDTGSGDWAEHIIDTGLLDAHSLAAADLCGNGNLDLFVGEIGAVERSCDCEDYIIRPPRLMVYENNGHGYFSTRHIIDEGTGTHEAVLIVPTDGRTLDIIGKPLHGPEQWKVHRWFRER